jgi:hypothetical protein
LGGLRLLLPEQASLVQQLSRSYQDSKCQGREMKEMAIKVRIVKVLLGDKEKDVYEAESELTSLLNDGWRIVAAAGGTGKVIWQAAGFVIVQKDE